VSTVALFSAKGAPGVTTTAMLVASLWPRPALLADCDPAGGDVGLRLPAPDGRPLDLARGMLSLLPVARRGIEPATLFEHTQQVVGGGEVIVGVTGPEQAAAAVPAVWSTLAKAFDQLDDHDVILDLGRLDSTSPVLALAQVADVVVCVLDANVAGVFAARARLRTMLPVLASADRLGTKVGVLVRATDRREALSASAVIHDEFPDLIDLGQVAHDRSGARLFDGQRVSRPERTLLVRSGVELVGALQSALYVTQWSPRGDGVVPATTRPPLSPPPAAPVPDLAGAPGLAPVYAPAAVAPPPPAPMVPLPPAGVNPYANVSYQAPPPPPAAPAAPVRMSRAEERRLRREAERQR
jgi:MinD-like ATPase involved in chromosome partitioning or flagellar assembly